MQDLSLAGVNTVRVDLSGQATFEAGVWMFGSCARVYLYLCQCVWVLVPVGMWDVGLATPACLLLLPPGI
jgi:hypothetical protein